MCLHSKTLPKTILSNPLVLFLHHLRTRERFKPCKKLRFETVNASEAV